MLKFNHNEQTSIHWVCLKLIYWHCGWCSLDTCVMFSRKFQPKIKSFVRSDPPCQGKHRKTNYRLLDPLIRWWALRFKMFKSCIPKWNDLHPPRRTAFLDSWRHPTLPQQCASSEQARLVAAEEILWVKPLLNQHFQVPGNRAKGF